MSVVESLEDLEGDPQQRHRAIALWVPQRLFRFRDRIAGLGCSSPSPGDFKLVHAGSEEIAKPGFESRPGVKYKLK